MTSVPAEHLASFLSGAWRAEPPPVETDEAMLDVLAPLLLGTGLGPLGWWRIRRGLLADTAAGQRLWEAFCRQALSAALQERHIERLVLVLRGAGAEPLILKGWANARLYPQVGLRPLGDVDLLVRARHLPAALAALAALPPDESRPPVDVKGLFPPLYGRGEEEIFGGASAAPLRGTWAGVLAPEEHLRMLCLHFLRHGAWRALWLCDIAALVEGEGRSPGFDWDRCLRGDRRAAEWIAVAVGLAHRLLGAEIEATPVAGAARRMPSWIAPAVLRVWRARRYYEEYQIGPGTAMAQAWPRPARVAGVLGERWPNPIEASLFSGSALGPVPATQWQVLPRQILPYPRRGAHFAARHRRAG